MEVSVNERGIAIQNVRVFDGTKLSGPRTVFVENGVISSSAHADVVVKGEGATLLPGLIDSHIHLDSVENLKRASYWGITTVLDMATQDREIVDSLRSQPGLTDIRSCHRAGSPAGSYHATAMGYPVIRGPDEGRRFVDEQVGFGADYIKIVLDDPNIPGAGVMTPDTIAAVARAAHESGRCLIAHAVASASFKLALENGVDVITHTPMGECISAAIVEEMAKRGILAVPTLVMMKGLCETFAALPSPPPWSYSNPQESVARFRQAGIPIIAGTDANNDPKAPFHPEHGRSLHDELELLVGAGLAPIDALRSATNIPAERLGLKDRGAILPGRRADFVLVDGDPTKDIRATRAIRAVYVAGVRAR
jgi:imidazolonepropionase-like amidohydrolase